MSLSLIPGEILRKGLRLTMISSIWSFLPWVFTPSRTIYLTNRRLIVNESYHRRAEVTHYIPLESVLRVFYGREAHRGRILLWLGLGALFLAVLAVPFTAGIATIPLMLIGAVLLFLFFRPPRETALLVYAGTETPIAIMNDLEVARVEDLDGNRLSRDEVDSLHEDLELARQQLVHRQGDPAGNGSAA